MEYKLKTICQLLFNIFINDIFYFVNDTKISNYADDNTPYKCSTNINSIFVQWENEGNILTKWFINNYMKVNADKCRLFVKSNEENYSINLRGIRIDSSSEEKLLCILVDTKLIFDKHINTLCSKASNKLFMQACNNPRFGYCSLIWMFHCNRQLYKQNK